MALKACSDWLFKLQIYVTIPAIHYSIPAMSTGFVPENIVIIAGKKSIRFIFFCATLSPQCWWLAADISTISQFQIGE